MFEELKGSQRSWRELSSGEHAAGQLGGRQGEDL